MRTENLLSICLLASMITFSDAQVAGPAATPVPHYHKRNMADNGYHSLLPRIAFPFGSSDDTGTDTRTDLSSSSSTGLTSSSSSISSSSTRPTTTSTSTSIPTSTSSSTSSSTTTSAPSSSSVVFVTSTIQPSSSSTSSAVPSQTGSTGGGGSSHTGLIVGVSVVGGVAILGALIFLYMKFGGKRFSDYQDDDADIKWPELKADENSAAMQPLPARRTGGAGFDMGEESEMGDAHSMNEYGGKAHESMLGSTTALNAGIGSSAYGAGSYAAHSGGEHDAYGNQAGGGVTGYYDPYGSYGGNHAQHDQQVFYPDQGYSAYGHDQGAYGVNSSPQQNPYRVGGQGGY